MEEFGHQEMKGASGYVLRQASFDKLRTNGKELVSVRGEPVEPKKGFDTVRGELVEP